MKAKIDEQILENVPDELIRPLLALCMRALRENSIPEYRKLIRELNALREACTGLEEQLLWARLDAKIYLQMHAMLEAEKWAKKHGHTAKAISVYVNRWYVQMVVDGENKEYVISYADDGIDKRRMEQKRKAVVQEAIGDDMASAMLG
ncbi:MAG TPA: hypothetical protein VFT66_25935 [Roseiflexaceae bacterium]|jgi:hypothetical protein|nr:hypothetical protein [Roseiflexaceae bacterium]